MGRWKALAARTRALLFGLAAAAFVTLAIATSIQRDTRVPLFAAPLRSEQVAEVVERLAAWDAPFVAASDNVRVEARTRNDLLLKLALAGVPHAHLDSSAEALAKAGPLTPQVVLEAQQRDGLAGDIAAGLRGLDGVADARVIIAPARDATFADESGHEATASVRLSLRPGASLSRDAIAGVRAYVAAAVPGLDGRRVALLDDRGLALGDDARAAAGDAATLERSLQSALDAAVGDAATIVRVRLSYDPRARSAHEVVRKPIGSRAIGTTTVDERFTSASKRYVKSDTAIDRGSDVRDETVEIPAGRLERISVAVAVDAARRLDLSKIRTLAAATLGLDAARGDTLSVEEIAFAHAVPPAPRSPLGIATGIVVALGPTLLVALALVACVRVGASPAARVVEALVRRAAIGRATSAVSGYAPAHVRGALRDEPPHTAAAIISALPAATATAVLEMYPPEERAAIVRRMARGTAPVVPDCETVLRRG